MTPQGKNIIEELRKWTRGCEFDVLVERVGMGVGELMGLMMRLEIEGIVERVGNMWRVSRG